MLVQLIFLILTIQTLHGTRVIDSTNQDGIFIADYCPKMEHCPEGSHTMCVYYDPGRIYGPKCANFQNVSITPTFAEKLLDLVNEMRGRVAMGIETGHGNVTLPRAFGMFKLKWDNELATFAQILANTCTVRFDLCRATKKFPDPGQLVCVIRFTIPEWFPISNQQKFSEKGLTSAKIDYAIQEVTKSWYQEKQHVTLDMLQKKPDWLKQPTRTKGKNFLQLVDGESTHMGCGIAAYVEYHYLGLSGKNIIYNTVHVVCNFSSVPRSGTSVFNMKNKDDGCGCPDNYKVDDRCLCTDPITKSVQRTCGKDKSCKPAVVLLPIFTAEDYVPPRPPNNSLRNSLTPEAANHLESLMQAEPEPDIALPPPGHKKTELYFRNPLQPSLSENLFPETDNSRREGVIGYTKQSIGPPYTNERINLLENAIDHENSDFNSPFSQSHWHSNGNNHPGYGKTSPIGHWNSNSNPLSNNGWNTNSKTHSFEKRLNNTKRNIGMRKESIFSKSPKFEIHSGLVKKAQSIKADVAPRKDFSHVQSVLDNYLDEKKKDALTNLDSIANHQHVIKPRYKKLVNIPKNEVPILNDPLQIKNNDIYKTLQTQHTYTGNFNEGYNNTITEQNIENDLHVMNFQEDGDSDKKLMTLLDTLEQEVKHIELDHNKKEIFDKKIRKIYGSIVEKPESLSQAFARSKSFSKDNKSAKLESETEHITFDDVFEDPKSFEKDMFDTEDRINELRAEAYSNPRPVLNHRQNGIHTKGMVRNHEGFGRNVMSDEEFESRIATNNVRKRKMLYKELDKDSGLYEKGSSEVRSVPQGRTLRSRNERRDPEVHLRSELEIDQPRLYKNKDFEKRALVPPKEIYKASNKPSKKRRLSKFHERKREYRIDDEKGNKLYSIDGPRIRYEEAIHADYIDGTHRTHFDDENINDLHDFDFDKEYKDEPLLPEDRRIFYQKKLNELERKIQPEKRFQSNHDMARQRRLIRRQRMQQGLRPNRHPTSSRRRLYVPSRSRSTHSLK